MRQCMDAENLHRRLKKILGQVQAIDRMIDEMSPAKMSSPKSMLPSQHCTAAAALFLRDISNTVCVTALNMVMPTEPLTVLPRRSNASPT